MGNFFDYRRAEEPKRGKFGVLAYGHCLSGSTAGEVYDVVRYRNRTYGCTCKAGQYYRGRKRCRHVHLFIEHERKLREGT